MKYFLPLWFLSILTVALWLRHNKCHSLFLISSLSCRILCHLLGAGELGSISGHLIVCSLLFPFTHTASPGSPPQMLSISSCIMGLAHPQRNVILVAF